MSPAETAAFEVLRSIGLDEEEARRFATSWCCKCGRHFTDHGITIATAGNDCGEFTPATDTEGV